MSKESQGKLRIDPLGQMPIASLLVKFAVPSIIAMIVGAIYNIVDQIFIGQAVGELGNAATNIAFPLSLICTSIGLLFGIGGASCFNLHMGRKQYEKAPYFFGNSAIMLFSLGTLLFIVTEVFLKPMLIGFGSPDAVLPYATTYVRITAIGFPFLILTTGGGHLLRADGSPNMTMFCSLSGAIINTVLDAVFIFGFGWGMMGAALATIIGQIFSGVLVIHYILFRVNTVKLLRKHYIPNFEICEEIASIGMGSFFNQLAMMVVQITLNNSLKYYGSLSIYGDSIPIACSGIVIKVNQLLFAVIIGIAQGAQPLESYNYGAQKYDRVKKTFFLAVAAASVISIISFILFQFYPKQILMLFGEGSERYYEFGTRFFRIYMFAAFINGIQPIVTNLFTAVGKAIKGLFMSLIRQIIFLLPLIVILPKILGIDGILYAGPIADTLAAVVSISFAIYEIKIMK
ncbi:Na+-driven multidrug efflux pump [Acetitomaculum ruminis DSM 5522]|uniref:Multidrug export protein MepA n=1 Tax=Acetitomaculum ruminis DSM 5522 TaxID=1120918 RepID=A0A1I0ZZT5_9FIRM|nr:MATE family efflux transporter [Acetitomaculum ruminis]SFB29653.1 Na+-driven multidrug efflux pump [Acetitomaculum ruminis DSM 5522]